MAIFQHRNEGAEKTYIDLHGLRVKEALGFLQKRLSRFLANDTADKLECVTGAGNHFPGQLAKIRPAVSQLCQRAGLQCQDDDNPGTFIIVC